MPLNRAAVGKIITSADYNAMLDLLELVPFTVALKPVIPTGFSGTGVSVALNGRVSFAGSTTVSIDGCFTDTYDHYRAELNVLSVSANVSVTAQLRSSGVDSGSTNYDTQSVVHSNATGTTSQSLAAASWPVSVSSALHKSTIELSHPALAVPTIGTIEAFANTNPGTTGATTSLAFRGIGHRASGAYDGITFTAVGGGNMTGTVRIYGWNDNTAS